MTRETRCLDYYNYITNEKIKREKRLNIIIISIIYVCITKQKQETHKNKCILNAAA